MNWLAAGLVCCAASIGAGAFGAHGLKQRLTPSDLELWETAARYLMYGGLGLSLLGLASQVMSRPLGASAACLFAGTLIFSSTVGALAVGGPRWLGAITPIGGLLMILGFFLSALSVFGTCATWRS